MHICPAEVVAALIMFEQAQYSYWYAKWRIQEFIRGWNL